MKRGKEALREILGNKKLFAKENLIVAVLVGILLLVIAMPTGQTKNKGILIPGKVKQSATIEGEEIAGAEEGGDRGIYEEYQFYTRALEEELEEILSAAEGVGEVRVMITLNKTARAVVERDVDITEKSSQERDDKGGTRYVTEKTSREQTIMESGGQENKPVISGNIYPQVEGVVVVCSGGGSAGVRRSITQAVLALFPIEAHKVVVVCGSNKNS